MTIESELGRSLENSPGRQLYDAAKSLVGKDTETAYEEAYEESLQVEPDKLLFHGSPAELSEEADIDEEFEKIDERYAVLREDAERITEEYGGKDLVLFEHEYEVLEGKGKLGELEGIGLNPEVLESDQEMAYDDWDAVEGDESVRSYTSAGNRQKLQTLGEAALPDADITVFGTPEFDFKDSVRHSVLNRFIDTPLQRTGFGRDQIRDESSLLNRARGYIADIGF